MDQRLLVPGVPQQAPHIRQQDQLLRPHGSGQLGSGGIRIDVVGGVCVHPLGHGGDHGDIAAEQGVFHRLRVHAGDPAHQAVLLIQLHRLEQLPVHAAQADGLAPQPVQLGHQIFVDLAAEDGLDHVHGLGVGIAQAVHKPAFVAELLQHLADLRPAAVDHHHPNANQGQQDDVAHDSPAEFVGHHGVAAVLDHDGLAGEFLDIGQGFHKRPRLLCVGGHRNINSFLENRRDSAGGGGGVPWDAGMAAMMTGQMHPLRGADRPPDSGPSPLPARALSGIPVYVR